MTARAFVIPVLLATAACGGGGSSGDLVVDPYYQLINETNVLFAKHEKTAFTPLESIPDNQTGSVEYEGNIQGIIAGLENDSLRQLTGRMAVTVSFETANPAISGKAYDFHDESGVPLTGALGITGGALKRTVDPALDTTFLFGASETDADGLVAADGRNLDFVINYEADFLGSDYQAIGGNFTGSVVIDSDPSRPFAGKFAVEQ